MLVCGGLRRELVFLGLRKERLGVWVFGVEWGGGWGYRFLSLREEKRGWYFRILGLIGCLWFWWLDLILLCCRNFNF